MLPFPALSPWADHAELKSLQGLALKGKTICSGALESDARPAGCWGFSALIRINLITFGEMLMNPEWLQVVPARLPCSPPGLCPFRLRPGTGAPGPLVSETQGSAFTPHFSQGSGNSRLPSRLTRLLGFFPTPSSCVKFFFLQINLLWLKRWQAENPGD